MSETTEQPGGPQPPEPAPPAEEPRPGTTEQPEQPEQPEPGPAREADKADEERRAERRLNRLTSRLASTARERDELAQRVSQYEAAQRGEGPRQLDPQLQQLVQQEARNLHDAERRKERTQEFHEAGRETYPDWQERCQNLMAMGADPQMADLLVEMRDGARVAAALSDEPEEIERIAAIGSERGRAIALGQFAAKVQSQPARQVSRAPRPPQPITARSSPQFNEYAPSNSTETLVEYYSKQAMEQQRQRSR